MANFVATPYKTFKKVLLREQQGSGVPTHNFNCVSGSGSYNLR